MRNLPLLLIPMLCFTGCNSESTASSGVSIKAPVTVTTREAAASAAPTPVVTPKQPTHATTVATVLATKPKPPVRAASARTRVGTRARKVVGHSLPRLTAPLSVRTGAVTGKGPKREAVLKVTNKAKLPLKLLVVDLFFLNGRGVAENDVPHTHGGFPDFADNLLPPGKVVDIEVGTFFMKPKTVKVMGTVRLMEFADGSKWPSWSGKWPKRTGNAPVSAKLLGVVGTGAQTRAVTVLFNHSNRAVRKVSYRFSYRNSAGKVVGTDGYGFSGSKPIMLPEETMSVVGSGKVPPTGAATAVVTVTKVTFADKTEWKP